MTYFGSSVGMCNLNEIIPLKYCHVEFHLALLLITMATHQTPSYPQYVKDLKAVEDGRHLWDEWEPHTEGQLFFQPLPTVSTALAISGTTQWTRTWFPTLFSLSYVSSGAKWEAVQEILKVFHEHWQSLNLAIVSSP